MCYYIFMAKNKLNTTIILAFLILFLMLVVFSNLLTSLYMIVANTSFSSLPFNGIFALLIIFLIIIGAIGLIMHRKWGRKIILYSSVIVVPTMVYYIFNLVLYSIKDIYFTFDLFLYLAIIFCLSFGLYHLNRSPIVKTFH